MLKLLVGQLFYSYFLIYLYFIIYSFAIIKNSATNPPWALINVALGFDVSKVIVYVLLPLVIAKAILLLSVWWSPTRSKGRSVSADSVDFILSLVVKCITEELAVIFDKNTAFLSLDDNLKINLINETTEYSLSKKDGLYFPSSTEFTIENFNDFDSRIIFCIGL